MTNLNDFEDIVLHHSSSDSSSDRDPSDDEIVPGSKLHGYGSRSSFFSPPQPSSRQSSSSFSSASTLSLSGSRPASTASSVSLHSSPRASRLDLDLDPKPSKLKRQASVPSLASVDGRALCEAPVPSRTQVQDPPRLRRAITSSSAPRPTTHSSEPLPDIQASRLMRRNSSAGGGTKLTRRQIEQHFDNHYSSDDLPDHSFMFNVPLSPLLYAKSKAEAAQRIQDSRQMQQKRRPRNPMSPLRNSLVTKDLMSIKEAEQVRSFPSSVGMEELSPEAQEITRALQDISVSPISPISTSTSTSTSTSANSSADSSPAVSRRSSDVFMSKEKEAILSKTRPAWLPPKCQTEDQKHLRQHQRLLEQAAQAERDRDCKRRRDREDRAQQLVQDSVVWAGQIIPLLQHDPAKDLAKFRPLWWRGAPAKCLGQIWKLRIGNRLGLSAKDYGRLRKQPNALLKQIQTDCGAVYPELTIFDTTTGPLHQDLVDLVCAYTSFRPAVQYEASLCTMLAVFMLNMDAASSFIAFANLFESSLAMAVWTDREHETMAYYQSFLRAMGTKLPSLHSHFKAVHLSPSAYARPWIQTWFAAGLPIDLVTRLWTIMVFEGPDSFSLRVSMAVLVRLQPKLYGTRTEILAELALLPKLLGAITLEGIDDFVDGVYEALKVA